MWISNQMHQKYEPTLSRKLFCYTSSPRRSGCRFYSGCSFYSWFSFYSGCSFYRSTGRVHVFSTPPSGWMRAHGEEECPSWGLQQWVESATLCNTLLHTLLRSVRDSRVRSRGSRVRLGGCLPRHNTHGAMQTRRPCPNYNHS